MERLVFGKLGILRPTPVHPPGQGSGVPPSVWPRRRRLLNFRNGEFFWNIEWPLGKEPNQINEENAVQSEYLITGRRVLNP